MPNCKTIAICNQKGGVGILHELNPEEVEEAFQHHLTERSKEKTTQPQGLHRFRKLINLRYKSCPGAPSLRREPRGGLFLCLSLSYHYGQNMLRCGTSGERFSFLGRCGRKNTPLPIDGTVLLYYLLYFFFRLTTVVPITAPPLMNRSALHKTRLLLSPVFGEAVFPDLSGWSLGFAAEPVAGISTAAFL